LPTVNQSASAVVTISPGSSHFFGSGKSLISPAVVMRPTVSVTRSVNQRAPSGPGVSHAGCGAAPPFRAGTFQRARSDPSAL
jgi:hypothetical protein